MMRFSEFSLVAPMELFASQYIAKKMQALLPS